MELAQMELGSICVCRISGRLDVAESDAFRSALHDVAEETTGPIVLDLEGVAFIGSACLGALIALRRHLGKDRPVALSGLSVPVHKLFKISMIDRLFDIHPSAQDAVSAMKSG